MPDDLARLLAGLSDAQRAAVLAPPGPLLVVAGPGAGKTRVLTARAAHWVACGSHRPQEILAITFTTRAAGELGRRLTALVGEGAARRMTLGTFHAVCHRLLRGHARLAGRSTRFSVWDQAASQRALAQVAREQATASVDIELLARRIGLAKAHLLTPERLAARPEGHARALARACAAYERLAAASDALDFDDLIGASVRVLESSAALRGGCRARWRAVLVDEYQDTNPAQARWLGLIAPAGANLTAVADDDQAVYRFRGADARAVLAFERARPGARVLTLTENYRSTRAIVASARALIEHNAQRRPKPLRAVGPPGPRVRVERHGNERAEAKAAADWCIELHALGFGWGELAVLYRTRAQARPLQDALAARAVAHRVIGGIGFFERAEIRDALAYLALLENPRDRIALARAAGSPRRGLGPAALAALTAHAQAHHHGDLVAACGDAGACPGLSARQRAGALELAAALGHAGAADGGLPGRVAQLVLAAGLARAHAGADAISTARLESLRELVRVARAFQAEQPAGRLGDFLAHAALTGDEEPAGGRVTLATVHAAKGLEWRAVRVVGLEAGVLPHARAEGPRGLEEERRLAYVAMTRAGEQLALSWCSHRRGKPRRASPFLGESRAAAA